MENQNRTHGCSTHPATEAPADTGSVRWGTTGGWDWMRLRPADQFVTSGIERQGARSGTSRIKETS